jgi:hypothetical protein
MTTDIILMDLIMDGDGGITIIILTGMAIIPVIMAIMGMAVVPVIGMVFTMVTTRDIITTITTATHHTITVIAIAWFPMELYVIIPTGDVPENPQRKRIQPEDP